MPRKIRVGIVGIGRISVDNHIPHIALAGGEVAALCDVVPGRAVRFAEQFGIPQAFDNHHPMLAQANLDAVAVCTPPHVRPDIAMAALQAGKHVYMEKPPALTAAALKPVINMARSQNLRLLVGSHQVYDPEMQLARRLVAEGKLGAVYYVEALKLIRQGIPRGWHRQRAIAGGGVTFDSSAHRLELALFLLGNPAVQSVTARTYNHFADLQVPNEQPGYQLMDVAEGLAQAPEKADVEDTVVAMIQFKPGTTLLLRDARIGHMRSHWDFRMLGTEGGVELTPAYAKAPERPLLNVFSNRNGQPRDEVQPLTPNTRGTHVPLYEHFFDCIRTERETGSSGNRALNVMHILDAIHTSANAGGRQINLSEV